MMPRWRVSFIGKNLGTVEPQDEHSAIAEAAKQFHITPAGRDRIIVTRLEDKNE
jgi:hypothetical protein